RFRTAGRGHQAGARRPTQRHRSGPGLGVPRVGIASTIGFYAGNGAQGALTEDMPLAMSAPHLIPTFKKIGELLDDYLAGATGIEIVNYRISGTWGPLAHSDPSSRPRSLSTPPRPAARPICPGSGSSRTPV